MKENLILFHTSGCHLCEEAEALLTGVLNPDFFCWEKIDIVEEDQLVEQYGIRIPVLKRVNNGAELGWPFDVDTLINFLSE